MNVALEACCRCSNVEVMDVWRCRIEEVGCGHSKIEVRDMEVLEL